MQSVLLHARAQPLCHHSSVHLYPDYILLEGIIPLLLGHDNDQDRHHSPCRPLRFRLPPHCPHSMSGVDTGKRSVQKYIREAQEARVSVYRLVGTPEICGLLAIDNAIAVLNEQGVDVALDSVPAGPSMLAQEVVADAPVMPGKGKKPLPSGETTTDDRNVA
ncbi:hypothetical protein IAR50_003688 [Cryptococcus sp. DSM 104548]